jgi:hypothetical protein
VLDDALPDLLPAQSNLAVGSAVFADAASHDYHLVEGAPPIDAGDVLAEVATDRDGVERPYGRGYDIGAYEWDPNAGTGDSTGGDDAGPGGDVGTGDDGAGDSGGLDGTGNADATAGLTDGSEADTGDSGGAGEGEGSGCNCRAIPIPASRGWLMLPALAVFRRRR